MEETVVSTFDRYLLSQTKRSSQNYQLWLLIKRASKARLKVVTPAPGIRDLARKLDVSHSQVRNRLSDLIAFYQEHLAVLHLRSAPQVSALLALERAIEMKDETYVSWAEKRVDRMVSESKSGSTYGFYDFLRFNRIISEWHADKFNRVYAEKTILLDYELGAFVFIEKCKLYLDTKSINNDGGPVLKKLDREIAGLRASREESVGRYGISFFETIYYHLYLIVREENAASYQFIFSNVADIFKKLDPRDANFVLSILTNRIARELIVGNNELQYDYFELAKTLLDFPEIRVTEWLLKNFITTLCRLDKVDFAEEILNVYLPRLPNDRQQHSFYYNTAIIKVARGELEEATELLGRITLTETTYYIGGRFVMFRALYKTGDYEGLLSLTKSFRGYVRGLKEIDDVFKKSAFNFLKYVNDLVRLLSEKPFIDPQLFKTRIEKLLEKVSGTSAMVSREWLIKEIAAHL